TPALEGLSRGEDLVPHFEFRTLIPERSRNDIFMAIAVDVGDRGALAPKPLGNLHSLEAQDRRASSHGCGAHRDERNHEEFPAYPQFVSRGHAFHTKSRTVAALHFHAIDR